MIYAPPELVLAYEDTADFTVSPAQDVWALGVMAYEVITGGATFPRHTRASVVFQCAHGTRPYPWERPQFQQQPVRLWPRLAFLSVLALALCPNIHQAL
jgi:serine/threonine protein kinase